MNEVLGVSSLCKKVEMEKYELFCPNANCLAGHSLSQLCYRNWSLLMIMFLSKESTTNLLLANICFSNLLIAFLVKVDHHVLLSFIGQFYQVSLVIVIVFQGESRYHQLIPANLCDLCQLCSFNWRVASKILMMMLLTPDWRGVWNISKKIIHICE